MKEKKHFFNDDTHAMKRLRLNANETQVDDQELEEGTLAEHVADGVVSFMGSWKFVIIQTIFLLLWGFLNVVLWVAHWDPYPFIAANLLLSAQAAYATPLIMMSQNRQAAKDQIMAEQDYQSDLRSEHQLNEIKAVLHTILDHQRDTNGKLQILYGEIQALKHEKSEMIQERHRLDQIFSVQSTVTRIEGITKEVQFLAQATEERRQRRGRLKEARMRRREVERLAEEIATIVHSMQQVLPSPPPPTTIPNKNEVDPETAELLPIGEEYGIATTQPMKRVETPL